MSKMNLAIYRSGAELDPDEVIEAHHARVNIRGNNWIDIRLNDDGSVGIYAGRGIHIELISSNRFDIHLDR